MKPDALVYKNGKYSFSISFEGIENPSLATRFFDGVKLQFQAFMEGDEKNCTLEFLFTDDLTKHFSAENWLNIGDIRFSADTDKLWYNQHGISFVYAKEGGKSRIYFLAKPDSGLKANCRFLNKSFLDSIEHQVSLFYYRIFLIFTFLENLRHRCAYIHGASIWHEENGGVLFPADSGVGKSSMLFRLSANKEYFYVADDLSILSEECECYYAGRAISTKPYHLSNFPKLKALIDQEMSFAQKIQWRILQDNRLVFGVDPTKLFQGRIKEKAPLNVVVHLVNTNKNHFTLSKSDPSTLAKASANIIMNEMILGNQIIYKALSIPGNDLLPSPGEAFISHLELYQQVFSKADTYLLEVPYKSHPEKMYDFLVKNGILS